MILSGLAVPLRALIVAAAGAAIAWGYYNDQEWLSIVAPGAVAVVGFAVSEAAASSLPARPVSAVRFMPWRILVPAAAAALAAGAVIIVTVELTLPDETPEGVPTPTDLKETVSALATAITTFLAAAFIDWTSDTDDSGVADWIKDTFHQKYEGVFKQNSRGEKLVYSSYVVEGWHASARKKRANGIKTALADSSQRA